MARHAQTVRRRKTTIKTKSSREKEAGAGTDGPRERLLDAAERLFAENGIKGASLRRIAAEAGHANNSAIQYHYGNKARLMREIILRRVRGFEAQRQQMLDAATRDGRLSDIRAMLEIIHRPIAEVTDNRGRHTYAQFIMHFITSLQHQAATEHPGWAPESAGTRAALHLSESLSFLDGPQLTARINRVGWMLYNALIERDHAVEGGKKIEPEEAFLDDIFTMMTAAIAAR